jgi:hypothetical protein
MQMLVVNPKRRKRRKGAKRGKKRRMTALQRQYFGGGRKTSGGKKRRKRRTAALATSPAPVRRSRRRRITGRRRSRSSGGRRMPRLSFNPKSFISDTLMPAAIGAGGALALDAALTFAAPYIPASLNTGIARTGVKIAGAIAIGMAASMIGGKRLGEQVMAGAIIVTAYGFLKPFAAGVIPGVAGYDMGWVSPAMQVGSYVGSDNAYTGSMPGMGVFVGESEENYYANALYA